MGRLFHTTTPSPVQIPERGSILRTYLLFMHMLMQDVSLPASRPTPVHAQRMWDMSRELRVWTGHRAEVYGFCSRTKAWPRRSWLLLLPGGLEGIGVAIAMWGENSVCKPDASFPLGRCTLTPSCGSCVGIFTPQTTLQNPQMCPGKAFLRLYADQL